MAAHSASVLENAKSNPKTEINPSDSINLGYSTSSDFEKRILLATSDHDSVHQNLHRSLNSSDSLKRIVLPNMKGRTRSASLGRDKKSDLKARYWAFLFENLQHAVDELYQTCETDENISECKEVILVLQNYTREFHSLTEWFRVKWEYENTPVPQRPNSLAWEIRKSSPGKIFHKNYLQPTLNGAACRKLLFELSENTSTATEGIERSSLRSLKDVNEFEKYTKVTPAENQNSSDNDSSSTKLSEKTKTMDNDETTGNMRDAMFVESWSQTDDDLASVPGKKPLTNVGRKITTGSTLYTKKMARNLSVPNTISETKTTFSSASSISSAKRFSTSVSPRKPVPGRNVAAAVFIPGQKIITNSEKSLTTNDSKTGATLCDSGAVKTKIPRSQSDPVFDTSHALGTKKVAIEEKPYLSAECVKNDGDKDLFLCHVDSLSASLVSSAHSLRVIDELASASKTASENLQDINEQQMPNNNAAESSNGDDIRNKPNRSCSVDDGGAGAGSPTVAVKTTCTKTVALITKAVPKTPTKNDSRPPSVTVSNAHIDVKTENLLTPTTNTTVTNGERKSDSLKKNNRIVVSNGALAGHKVARNQQKDGNNQVARGSSYVFERRSAPVSSFSKSRSTIMTQSYGQSCQGKAVTKHTVRADAADSIITLIAAKNNGEVKISKTNATWTTKQMLSGDGEKRRSVKAHSNNYSFTAATSNSFRDGFKRNGLAKHSCNMTRSKTSVDLKSNDMKNRATALLAVANPSKKSQNKDCYNVVKNCENDCSPRRRRSSKDTDGWETVISKSRRSIPNSFHAGAKSKSFDVNNRFYEPSSSTSLPILVLEDDGFATGNAVAVAATNDKTAQRSQPQQHHNQQHHHHHQHHRHIEVKSKSALEMKSHNKNRNRNNSYGSNNSNGNRDSVCATDTPNENRLQTVDGISCSGGVDYNDYKLRNERPIISSTAMFTTIQPKRKKLNEKDNRKSKATSKENKICGGSNNNSSITPAVDFSLGERTNEESANEQGGEDLLDDEESLRKSKELYEKEISLQKEINELQKDTDLETDVDADLDVDGDSDSTEVDQEIVDLCSNNNDEVRRSTLEMKYEHILANMTWAERAITLDKLEELLLRDPSGKCLKFAKKLTSLKQLEDLVSRAPGRALELHQKLSSPSRKRISPDTTILQHKARQAKAERNREQLLQDKSAKLRELLNKVAEVKAMQDQLVDERRKLLEQKLKRAEQNRNLHLRNIQEKAHDEAKKQKEIAFINELEAQNKRHEFYALCQEQEDRLQSILEDRQRRQEEKAAKDAAVEERRKAIEAERQEKNEELQEKMRKREERIDREFQEKERERIKAAREKARDREDRLLALQAAQIAKTEELQKKIQQKQENSARRHEENIELIRQKAIEIGTPRLTPYQINKLCSVCNVVIDSEVFLLSHLRGRSHQEAVKKYREQFEASVKFTECSIITDAPADVLHEKRSREKERQNTLRKRCKKIRHRLSNRSETYLKSISAKKDKCKKVDSLNKGRILKSIKEIEKLINSQGNGVWPNNAVTILERNLFEIFRILEKCHADDQRMFREFDGFDMLSKVYNLALDLPKNMSPYLPLKCFIVASNLFAAACNQNVENCLYVLLSNNLIQILDFLLNRLNLIMPNSDDRNGMVVYKADTVADVLMNVCSNVLSIVTLLTSKHDCPDDGGDGDNDYDLQIVSAHLRDIVSYVVCTGIVDKLAVYCSSVHDNKSADSYFLLHCMELLTQLVETRRGNITNKEDCTQLMATLKATELVGAVSMLYAILLHQDSMSNENSSASAVLRPDVVIVIIATLRLFSKVAELNLKFFQDILGAEGISLQVRHIISYLLRYCTQNDCCKNLLHQVIEFIGFFAIHHTDNQLILQSGSTPTVLQQLSSLPFAYFSNPVLVRILFPTLLACCIGNPQNRTILDQEVSFQLLEDFQNAQDSKSIPLIKLLQEN